MTVFFHELHRQNFNPIGSDQHNREHGENRNETEGGGHNDQLHEITLGRRVHDDRNQWLARAKNEDREKDPRSDVGFALLIVNVQVL